MSRAEQWLAEHPRRPASECACAFAGDRFWRDERARLIGVHPEWPEAAWLLGLGDEIAHALVLVLSRVPKAERRSFADAFFELRNARRGDLPRDHRARLAAAAQIALLVLDLTERAALQEAAVVDLLQGAAQADDLTATPEPVVERLRKTVATIRFDLAVEDDADPHAVASIAVVEVLDPSSDDVAVKEILARAAYATVECRSTAQTLAFLLDADRIVTGAA